MGYLDYPGLQRYHGKVQDEIDGLKDDLSEITRNIVFQKITGAQIESNGTLSVDNSYDVYIAPVTAEADYVITTSDNPYAVYAFFTSIPSIGSSAYGGTRYVTNTPFITAPITGYVAVRCSSGFAKAQIEEGTKRTAYIPHVSATDFIAREQIADINENFNVSKNLIDPDELYNGFIASSLGTLTSSEYYYTTDFIPVSSGQKITISPTIRKFLAYDEGKNAISDTYETDSISSAYTFTATVDGYIRASYPIANNEQAEYGESATSFEPYGKTLDNDFRLNQTQLEQVDALAESVSSVLYGNKIVFCGDSFTQGDFSGLSPSEYTFPSGKYAGKNMVYPYFIGLKTGAEIVNEAISGSTMAYVDGQRNEFSTPNGRYTQIPADADYIVLYFGINDSHQQVSIGTIDDNVNTTFYGAWNIVMQYLITNYPDAKIGIIISNGCDNVNYPNAEIAIAKKYGVSYLDINGDYKIPIVFRVNGKPDIDPSILSARLSYYAVNPTGENPNYHPNVKMHKYESTIFQSWLESI